jgi:hypothetical protein
LAWFVFRVNVFLALFSASNPSDNMFTDFKRNLLLFVLVFGALLVQAQQKKEITLAGIYQQAAFAVKTVSGVNWMKDGRFYSSEVQDQANQVSDIVRYEVRTGKAAGNPLFSRIILLARTRTRYCSLPKKNRSTAIPPKPISSFMTG